MARQDPRQSQLRWAGHVARMSDERLPKKLLFGELQQGKRSQGGKNNSKRFKDTLKASLKAFDISHNTWEQSAQGRAAWRSAVHKGAKACETNRTAVAEECRPARKNRANNPTAATTIPCPHCHRLFRARIGLASHLRTHRVRPPLPQDEQMVLVVPTDEQHIQETGGYIQQE